MSRTPLYRALRSCYRLARISNRTGEPPGEIADRRREALAFSRRRFLSTTALAGAGLALGCRSTRPATGGREVAIFGGGIAGLAAAYRLHQEQIPVRVYEAQERVGGRMFSLSNAFPGWPAIELGGELIDTGHERMQALVAELELELLDYQNDDPAMRSDTFFFGGRIYTEAEVIAAFRPVAKRVDAARAAIGVDWVTHAEPGQGATFDRQTLAEWLDSVPMEPWFRQLLGVGYVTEFGLELEQQSALNFLLMIGTESEESFDIFGESDERFHIVGGNDQVPRKLADRLGDRVVRGALLEAIEQRPDGSYRCTVRRGATSSEVVADHVIVAIPFTLLRDVDLRVELPAAQRRAIDELGYGTNAKLMVGFAKRLWRAPGGSNGSTLTDLPYQLSWENTRLLPGDLGVLVNFTGGRHGVEIGDGTPAHQAAAFAGELDKIFPGVAALRSGEVRFHWPSHPWARGSYACYKPGQYTGFGGEEGRAVGGLHFAGEHTSSYAQGFMEGGCESGERAAGEVMAALGIRSRRAA